MEVYVTHSIGKPFFKLKCLPVSMHKFWGIIEPLSQRRGDRCQWAKWHTGFHRHASGIPGTGTGSTGTLYTWSNPTGCSSCCLFDSGHAWKIEQNRTWNNSTQNKYISTNSGKPNAQLQKQPLRYAHWKSLVDICCPFQQSWWIYVRFLGYWNLLADICCPFLQSWWLLCLLATGICWPTSVAYFSGD